MNCQCTMNKSLCLLCGTILFVLSFWSVINTYHMWLFWNKRDIITSCFIHPFYICLYAGMSMLLYMSYILVLMYRDTLENLTTIQKIIILEFCTSYIFIAFATLMNINSKSCTREMKTVDSAIYAYMWGHFIINFTAFLVVGLVLKGRFPFFDNYIAIMVFLLNNYNISTAISRPTIEVNLTEIVNHVQQLNVEQQPTVEERKIPPDPLEEKKIVEEEKRVIEEEKKVVDEKAIIRAPPGLPPPHIIEAVNRCQEKIKDLRQQNPNGNYQIMMTRLGIRIIETHIPQEKPSVDILKDPANSEIVQHCDGLRRRNSGES